MIFLYIELKNSTNFVMVSYHHEYHIKLMIYNSSMLKNSHLMKNYWKEMYQYLFITKIFKLLPLRCFKI